MENIFEMFKSKDHLGPPGHIPDSRKGVPGSVSGTEFPGNAFAGSDASSVDGKDGAKSPGNCTSEDDEKRSKMDYTIPKLKRKDSVLLRLGDSHEINKEIKPAIKKSFQFSPHDRYIYTRFQIVQNGELTNAYLEKRKEMKKAGYSERELADTYAFLLVESEPEMLKICREGVKRGNLDISCLGHPEMAVQLCRHADVLRPVPFPTRYVGHFIVFKIMKGRVKFVVEQSNNRLEPTPNFDCHLAKSSCLDLPGSNTHTSFESQQFYLYEYGEMASVEDRPRHVCPLAVVDFTYKYRGEAPLSRPPESPVVSPRQSPAPPRPTPPTPKEKVDEEFIIWCGRIDVKGSFICDVQMLSTAGIVKPCRLGSTLKLHHKCKMAEVKEKFFGQLASLRRNGQVYWKGNYINTCEMRPDPISRPLFEKLYAYLGRSESAAAEKIGKDTILLLLPPCQLTYQLGLLKPFDFDKVLHCIFISKMSCCFNSPRYQFKQSSGLLSGNQLSPLDTNASSNGPPSPSVFTPPPSTPTDPPWPMGSMNSPPWFPPLSHGLPVSPPPVGSLALTLLPPPPPSQSFAPPTPSTKPYPGSSPSLLRPLGRQRSPSGSQPSLAMEHLPASPGSPGCPLMLSPPGPPQRGSPSPFRPASLSVPSDRLSHGRSASTEEPFMEGDRSAHGNPHRPRALSSPNPHHHPDAARSSQPSSVHMVYDPSRSSLPSNSHVGFDVPRSQPSQVHIAYEEGFQIGEHPGVLSLEKVRKSFASQLRLMQERTAECEQDATISSTFTEDAVEPPASQPQTPQSSQLYSPVAPILPHAPRPLSRQHSCSHSPGTESPSWSVDLSGGMTGEDLRDGETSAKRFRMASQEGAPPGTVDGSKGSSIRQDRASMRSFLDSTINRDEANLLKTETKTQPAAVPLAAVPLAAVPLAAQRPDSSTDATVQGLSPLNKAGIFTANEMKNFLNASLSQPPKPAPKPAPKPPVKPSVKPKTDVPGAKPPSKSILKKSKPVDCQKRKSSQDKASKAHHHLHHHRPHHHSGSNESRRKFTLPESDWQKINRKLYILNGRVPVVAVKRLDAADILHKCTLSVPDSARRLGLEGVAAAKRKLFGSNRDPIPHVDSALLQAKPKSGRSGTGEGTSYNLSDRLCGPTALIDASHDHEDLPILKLKRSRGHKWKRVQSVPSKDDVADLRNSVQLPSAATSPSCRELGAPDQEGGVHHVIIRDHKSQSCHRESHSSTTQELKAFLESSKSMSNPEQSNMSAAEEDGAHSESLLEDSASTSYISLADVLSPSKCATITVQSDLKLNLSSEKCIWGKHSKHRNTVSDKESGKLSKLMHQKKHHHSHHSKTKGDALGKSGSMSSKPSHGSKESRSCSSCSSKKKHKKSKHTEDLSRKTQPEKEKLEPAPRAGDLQGSCGMSGMMNFHDAHEDRNKDMLGGSADVKSQDPGSVAMDSAHLREHLKTCVTGGDQARCDPAIGGAQVPPTSKKKKHPRDQSCEGDSLSQPSKSTDRRKDLKSKKPEKKIKDSGTHHFKSKDSKTAKVKSIRKEDGCKRRSSSSGKKIKKLLSDLKSTKTKNNSRKDGTGHTKGPADSKVRVRPRENGACEVRDDSSADVPDEMDLHSQVDQRETWSSCEEGPTSPADSDSSSKMADSCWFPETGGDCRRKEGEKQPDVKDADQAEMSGQSQKGFPSSFKRKVPPSEMLTAGHVKPGPLFSRRSVVDLPWQFTSSASSYRESYGTQNYPGQTLSSTFLRPDSSAFRSPMGMDLTAAHRSLPTLRPPLVHGLPGRSDSKTLPRLHTPGLMATPQATQMQLPLPRQLAPGVQSGPSQANQLWKLYDPFLVSSRPSLFSQSPSSQGAFRRGVATTGYMATPPCPNTLNHLHPFPAFQARPAGPGRAERPAPGDFPTHQRLPLQHSSCLKRPPPPDAGVALPAQHTVGMQSAGRNKWSQSDGRIISSDPLNHVAYPLTGKASPAAAPGTAEDDLVKGDSVPVSTEESDESRLPADCISTVPPADVGKEETASEFIVESLLPRLPLHNEPYDFSTDEDVKSTGGRGTKTALSEASVTAHQSKAWDDASSMHDNGAVPALFASEDLKKYCSLKEDVQGIPLPSLVLKSVQEMEMSESNAAHSENSLTASLPASVSASGEAPPGDICHTAADQTALPSGATSNPNMLATKAALVDEEGKVACIGIADAGITIGQNDTDAEGSKCPLTAPDSEDSESLNSVSTPTHRRVVIVTEETAEAADGHREQERLPQYEEPHSNAQRSDDNSDDSSNSLHRRRQPFRFGMASEFLKDEKRELSGKVERSRDVVEDRHRRQHHPYQRTHSSRKSFATFDLLYTKKELFGDLTTSNFKQKRLKGEVPTESVDKAKSRFGSVKSGNFCRKTGRNKVEKEEKDYSSKVVPDELHECEAEAAEEEETKSLQERIKMADMLDDFYEEQRQQEADDTIFDQQKELYQSPQNYQESLDYEPMDLDEEEEDGTNLIEYVHEAEKWNPRNDQMRSTSLDARAFSLMSLYEPLGNRQLPPTWQTIIPAPSLPSQPAALTPSSATASLRAACDRGLLLSLLQGAPPPPPPPPPPSLPPLPRPTASTSCSDPAPCPLPASPRTGPEATSLGECGGLEESAVASGDKAMGLKDSHSDKLSASPAMKDLPDTGGESTCAQTQDSGRSPTPAQSLSGEYGQTATEAGQSGTVCSHLGLEGAQAGKPREPLPACEITLSGPVDPAVFKSDERSEPSSSGVSTADIRRVLVRYGVPQCAYDVDEISKQLNITACSKCPSLTSSSSNPLQPLELADSSVLLQSGADLPCSSLHQEPSGQESQAVLAKDRPTAKRRGEPELESSTRLPASVTEGDLTPRVTGGPQTPKKGRDDVEPNPGSQKKLGAGDEADWVETPEKGRKAKFRKCRYSWDAAKMFVNKVVKPWTFEVHPITLDCRVREYTPNPDLLGMDVVKMNGAGMKDPRLAPRSRRQSSKCRSDRARPGAHPRSRLDSHASHKGKFSRLSHPGSELSSKAGSLREKEADRALESSSIVCSSAAHASAVAQSGSSAARDGEAMNEDEPEVQELTSSTERPVYSCHQSSCQQDPRMCNPFYKQTLGLDGKPGQREDRIRSAFTSENSTAPCSSEDSSCGLLEFATNHAQQRRNKTSQRLDEVLMSIMSREDDNRPPASTTQGRKHTAGEAPSGSGYEGLLHKTPWCASSQSASLPSVEKGENTLDSWTVQSCPPWEMFSREKPQHVKMAAAFPSMYAAAGDPLAEMKHLQGTERHALPQCSRNVGFFDVSRPKEGCMGNAVEDSSSCSQDVATRPTFPTAAKKNAFEHFTTSITNDDYYCQVGRKATWAAGSGTRSCASLGSSQPAPVPRENAMVKLSLPLCGGGSKGQQYPSLMPSCKGSSLFGACHAQTLQTKEDVSVLNIMTSYGAGKASAAEQSSAAKNPFEQLLEMPAAKLLIKNFKHSTGAADAPPLMTTTLKKAPRQDPRLARQQSLLSEPAHLNQ